MKRSDPDRQLTGEQLDARLRAACVWSDAVSHRQGVDMSTEAITRRVLEWAEMTALCLELGELGHTDGRDRGHPLAPGKQRRKH